MMKKIIASIVVVLLVILVVMLTSCSSQVEEVEAREVFSNDVMLNCEQGIYDLDVNMSEKFEIMGYPAESVGVLRTGLDCDVYITLKNSTTIYGVEKTTFQVMTCEIDCFERYEGYAQDGKYNTSKEMRVYMCCFEEDGW